MTTVTEIAEVKIDYDINCMLTENFEFFLQRALQFVFKGLTQECESVNILLTGKTGVGKSSLINAITGYKVAREGKNIRGVTREVTAHKCTINGTKFEIWDSPGLQDITEDDKGIRDKISSTLKKECHHLHLFLYCIRMDRDRFERSEVEAIKFLSAAFTPKIWEISVFALTYANRVLPPPNTKNDEEAKKWFMERLSEFQSTIMQALTESGVDRETAARVPVVPIGYHEKAFGMPKPRKLLDRLDWFNPFWNACAKQMEEKSLIPLLASQKHRIKYVSGKTTVEKEQELAEEKQNLEKNEEKLQQQLRRQEEMESQQLQEESKADEALKIEEQRRKAEECKKQEEIECLLKKIEEEEKKHNRRESEIEIHRQEQLRLEEEKKRLEDDRQLQLDKEREKRERKKKENEERNRKKRQELETQKEKIATDIRRVKEKWEKLEKDNATATESENEVSVNA